MRGVLEVPETIETDEARAAFDRFALLLLEKALIGLEEARRSEGAALNGILSGHIDQIEQLTSRAEADRRASRRRSGRGWKSRCAC